MTNHITVHAQTVQQFLNRPDQWNGPYDLLFADPPYAMVKDLVSLFTEVADEALFAPDSWLVVEHAAKTLLPSRLGRCAFLRGYHYGDTALSIFSSPDATQA